MSIVDYQKGAKLSVERIFNNKNISDKNKSVLKKYLKIYNVSPARLAIFLSHITSLLEGTDDITKEMNDRDKIADLFNRIKNSKSKIYKKKICLSTYGTKVRVSLQFVRWLNNGEIPKGFKDIKRVSVKKEKRDLSPKDMVTWEEAEQLMNATNSIQLKAIIAIQLDGGFRPSEFIDLNYGDVTIKDQFIVVEVKKGKTGRRNVILWRAVPYILRWCKAHPTKKPNDPLWVQEDQTGGAILRYKYPAIRKRVTKLFKKIGLEKPSDFYNLRHSACVLSKKDAIREEIAAKKFGHSILFYTETYGRLSVEDDLEIYSQHYGINKPEKKNNKKTIGCKCGFVNEPDTEICEQCGNPISLGKALEIKSETEKRLETMMKKLEEMEKTQMVMAKAIKMGVSITDKEAMENNVIPTFFDSGELDPEEEAKN